MKRKNSNTWPLAGGVFFLGYAIGLGVGNISTNDDTGSQELQQIQQYNQQIQTQLDGFFDADPVEDLILTGGESFTFHISPNGVEQQCTGTYSVNQDAAGLVGEIVCSTATPVTYE